jgi:dTDP-4-amino-4,6-dideoxygalactose transaminase
LPIYPEISREAQRYVVDAIAEFYGSQLPNQPKTT